MIRATRATCGFGAPLAQCLTILHCTSNYPASPADVNLRAMNTIGAATGLPVGYSDHTAGIAVATAAVALGATVIEKHFTRACTLPGPEHRASLEPAGLAAMINQPEDAREIHEQLREKLNELRAVGMPLPADLVALEAQMDRDEGGEAEA